MKEQHNIMVFFVTLCRTAGIVLARLPIYFLCTVGVAAPTVLVEWANPEFASNRRYLASHGAADLALALAIGLAILAMPFHAIAILHTTTRSTHRVSMYALFRNGTALTLLTAFLALGWHLALFWNKFPPTSPFHLGLTLITIAVLLRCSIVFPIALMENRSAAASLALSWHRMRWHWLTAGVITGFCAIAVFSDLLVFAPAHGQTVLDRVKLHFAYAAIQVAWTVAITCLYVHVRPEAANPSPIAPGSPHVDASKQDEQHGQQAPLNDTPGVARSE